MGKIVKTVGAAALLPPLAVVSTGVAIGHKSRSYVERICDESQDAVYHMFLNFFSARPGQMASMPRHRQPKSYRPILGPAGGGRDLEV